jgi:hypothetical protein
MTNVTDIKGTDAAELSRAELVCRRQMEAIVAFLRKYAPGCVFCGNPKEIIDFHGKRICRDCIGDM